MAFWYSWNSWVVELLGGAVLMGVLLLIAPLGWALVIGCVISVVYELLVDVNGWSWKDVGQRTCGMGIALGIWVVV